MSRLISSFNITVDGFCDHKQSVADPGHNLFANELVTQAGAVLFGKTTYLLFEAFWPKAANDDSLSKEMRQFGQLIDDAQKIVVSKTMKKVSWKNTTLIHHIDKQEVEAIKEKFPKGLLMFGSPTLLASLTKENAIDDYYFSIQPLMGGKGKRLFDSLSLEHMQNLEFMESKTFTTGINTLHYKKARR